MAQWSHKDRTLYAKVVYYGPAFGGKTTNLESLHRIADPDRTQQLLSVQTSDDRTLFFDLLPFDLGDILGYQVALKLYTVPGQVRYETTRQVVLSGADAVVFVADSCTGREEQNRWSLQNLRMNMRTRKLDPSRVPVLFQFNKQDLPDAASPSEVAGWLGVRPEAGVPGVATNGTGVLESFRAGCRAMIEALVSTADERTRDAIDTTALSREIDRAFAPHLERFDRDPSALSPAEGAHTAIEFQGEDLLEGALQATVELGERLLTGRR